MPDPADNGHRPDAPSALAELCSPWCPVSCPRRATPAGECEFAEDSVRALLTGDDATGVPGDSSGQSMQEQPSADDATGPLLRTISAEDLMVREFPEPVWAVPGLVCEGVNLLAGAPKVGKSWLALGLAVAVAGGGSALGRLDVQPGPVLYLALEDTARRLQTRLSKVLAGKPAPANLALATQAPTLSLGASEGLHHWLGHHPGARLVIIDVFARIRGTPPAALSAYEADYQAVSHVKKLADHHRAAVLLVHHTRKSSGATGDYLEEVSGTNGLAGAADATLVLRRSRGQADAELSVTGRDIDEAAYAMTFAADQGAWTLLDGPPAEHTATGAAAAILSHLRDHPTGRTPSQITAALDLPPGTIKGTLRRMCDKGQLATDGHGLYFTTTDIHP